MENVLEQLSTLTKTVDVVQTNPTVVESPIIDNDLQQNNTNSQEISEIPESISNTEFQTEDDVINYVMQSLQVEGFTPTQQGIDAIIELAKYKVQNIEEQYNIFNRTEILELKEHLEQGGDVESFKAIQALENPYDDLEYREDDVETLEALARHIYIEIQGMDESDAEALIEMKKVNATLFDFVDTNIPKLKYAADKANEEERNAILEIKQKEQLEVREYTNKMKEAIRVNNFGGVKIPTNILSKIEQLSFADKNGRLGIKEDVWNKMTPEQDVLMNYFSYCIVNNLPIEYKPSYKVTGVSKPIHQMFNKSTPVDSKGTIADLLKVINSSK